MLASFDTSPLRMNVIAAYAPHAGKSKNEKLKFYKELNDVFDNISSHEINIILGDFNARLMEQLPHEIDIFGSYIFREDNSTIEQLSEQQQENRQYFAELCQERRLVVMNTMFQKDSARLITYKIRQHRIFKLLTRQIDMLKWVTSVSISLGKILLQMLKRPCNIRSHPTTNF